MPPIQAPPRTRRSRPEPPKALRRALKVIDGVRVEGADVIVGPQARRALAGLRI